VAEATVFDVFAGTGSLGLEALSRGARHATFFESDPSAAALLRKNIETLKLQSRSTVVAADLFAWFARAEPKEESVDLVFLDPPYRYLKERSSELQSLANNIRARLAPAGQVIFRHDVRDSLELPALSAFDMRDYGSMRLEFLRARV
jgi:16S rRNA (guanine966-N2)-methyltransferase